MTPSATTNNKDEECDDCGMIGALWASISHGTILCDECASAHRNLGRHVSQVRCLKSGLNWPNSLLHMLRQMSSNRQANRLLEFELNAGKPCAFDTFDTKYAFIRQKYELLAFVKRLSDNSNKWISCQLKRAVQKNDLVTTFWLLLCGANPNYKDSQQSSSVLCDSAQLGHSSIFELLCIWGGDLSSADLQFIASSHGFVDLAERISELEMELTTRITDYVHRRQRRMDVLDHNGNNHQKKRSLQDLPESCFAELLKDIYDEIDRREMNQLFTLFSDWQRNSNESVLTTERLIVPFLPVIPHLSATRNQGRQKLARFSTVDFFLFLSDVVSDMKRRSYGSRTTQPIRRHYDSIYDRVASDSEETNTEYGSKDLKTRVVKLESQLKQLSCVNEQLKQQMNNMHDELISSKKIEEPKVFPRISQNMESDYDNAVAIFNTIDDSKSFPKNESDILEQSILRVIRGISELHELIKLKQRSDYEETSRNIVEAVRQLCDCANHTNRTVAHLITDLDLHATKLLSIVANQKNLKSEQVLIDCCYQIGFCTKSLVALLNTANKNKLQ